MASPCATDPLPPPPGSGLTGPPEGRLRKGWGWRCGNGAAGRARWGASAIMHLSPNLCGYTTTQPSSIEEEGFSRVMSSYAIVMPMKGRKRVT